MKSMRSQRGISLWMALLVIICLVFAGLIALKLGPVYFESYQIDRALSNVKKNEDLGSLSKRDIRDAILRRFDIDGIKSVRYADFNDVATIEKDESDVSVTLVYEVIVPIVANVSALVEFEKTMTSD